MADLPIPIIGRVLGGQLQRSRKQHALTQVDAAEKRGVPRSTYGRHERDPLQMTLREYLAICDALGANPSRLLQVARDTAEYRRLCREDPELRNQHLSL